MSFVLHGKVSCNEAHRTMRAYARAIADGRCTSEICTEVVFAAGWTCSAAIPALLRPKVPLYRCERSGASFDLHKATRQSGTPASPASFAVAGDLSGVAATSANNAWAVGSTRCGKTLIVHWNGTAWAQVPSPAPAASRLAGVAATSAGNAWAVGDTRSGKTLILHWNRTVWKRVASPSPDANMGLYDYLGGVAETSAGGVWAVGDISCGCGPGGSLIERWKGNVWKQVRSPGPGGYLLSGVAAVSANNTWVVGATGEGDGPTKAVILRWNGAAWTQVPTPSAGAYGVLSGVAVTSASNAWAVGSSYTENRNSRARSNFKTVILHWNGTLLDVTSPNRRRLT